MADSHPDAALLHDLLLGKLPPDEVERLCVAYADDERLGQLAEALAGEDTLLGALREQSTVSDAPTDPRVERLIGRLVQLAEDVTHDPADEATPALPRNANRAGIRPVPASFEHYRVLKILGEGGMGTVYLAEDTRLHRQVALKTLRENYAANPSARERFLREARAVAAIEHDHIVPVYHVSEAGGVPFLAMPLLKGEPLDWRLRRANGPLP